MRRGAGATEKINLYVVQVGLGLDKGLVNAVY